MITNLQRLTLILMVKLCPIHPFGTKILIGGPAISSPGSSLRSWTRSDKLAAQPLRAKSNSSTLWAFMGRSTCRYVSETRCMASLQRLKRQNLKPPWVSIRKRQGRGNMHKHSNQASRTYCKSLNTNVNSSIRRQIMDSKSNIWRFKSRNLTTNLLLRLPALAFSRMEKRWD